MPSKVNDGVTTAMSGVRPSGDVRLAVPRVQAILLVSIAMNLPGPLLVSAADVGRVFGEGEAAVHALDGVTVGFPKGRFTAIMGPSGSGKSTLMHILAGLDRPTSGSVVLDGVEITSSTTRKLTELRRERIGFVFQSFNLCRSSTPRRTSLLPLSIAGTQPDAEWLDQLDRAPSASATA